MMQFEVAQIQFTSAKNNFAPNLFYACAYVVCIAIVISQNVLHGVISNFPPASLVINDSIVSVLTIGRNNHVLLWT